MVVAASDVDAGYFLDVAVAEIVCGIYLIILIVQTKRETAAQRAKAHNYAVPAAPAAPAVPAAPVPPPAPPLVIPKDGGIGPLLSPPVTPNKAAVGLAIDRSEKDTKVSADKSGDGGGRDRNDSAASQYTPAPVKKDFQYYARRLAIWMSFWGMFASLDLHGVFGILPRPYNELASQTFIVSIFVLTSLVS
jgi:hypothetical protein